MLQPVGEYKILQVHIAVLFFKVMQTFPTGKTVHRRLTAFTIYTDVCTLLQNLLTEMKKDE
jgi:hypothetical protein